MLQCNHCLLEFPDREAVRDNIDGAEKVFCCSGCNGIYRLIHFEGLDDFYSQRKWPEKGISASFFTKKPDIKPFAEHVTETGAENRHERQIDLYIDNIRCASCVWLNEKILSRTEGVSFARVNYATHRARIRWDPEITGLEKILGRIMSIGYMPKPFSGSEGFMAQKAETRDLLIRFGTAGFLSSQLMIYSIALYAGYFQGIDAGTKRILELIAMVLTVPVIFYSGMPLVRNTLIGLRRLHFSMDSLIVIGACSAFVYSIYEMVTGGAVYFDTAAMIITLILLGRYLEAIAKGKASEAVERLIELTPKTAVKVLSIPNQSAFDESERETVPLSSVLKGDLLEVKPGERVPIDGRVIGGESETDESLLTGESRPVSKRPGDEVIGGSMNLYGSFMFEVTKTGKDTVLAGIIRAVEDAQERKPRIQAFADRVVGVFVPAIMLISFLTFMFYMMQGISLQKSLMTAVSVLVIACPCSLGLATPIAVMIFAAVASSRGILIRGGEVIEKSGVVRDVLFDKTGTITLGKSAFKDLLVFDRDFDRGYLLSLAASVESHSEHSLGHAICEAAKAEPDITFFRVSEFRAVPGKGVEGLAEGKKIILGNRTLMSENMICVTDREAVENIAAGFEKQGDTVIFMAWDERLRALLVIADVIRSEAADVVSALRDLHCDTTIISGDNSATTGSIAEQVGISRSFAGALPEGKKDYIAKMQKDGRKVMMIGDGINDAPALTEASVGVAMGKATDIAIESADVVLTRNDLRLIPYFIALSRKTFSVIKTNIFWSFFYNIIAIPLAVAGLLHPIIAAGAMAASSLFVVVNSLRIRTFNP